MLDVNSLDYPIWGVLLKQCRTFHPTPKNTNGLKEVLQLIWDLLLEVSIIMSLVKRLELL